MKVLLSLFLMLSLIACSGSKSTNEAEGTDASAEMADGEDFSEDFSEDFADEGGDEMADEGGDDFAEEEGGDEFAELDGGDEMAEEGGDEVADAVDEAPVMEEASMDVVETQPVMVPSGTSGDTAWHTVSSGETLMIIAFKIYGDYDRWRDLARWNSGKIGPNHSISRGMQIQYEVPNQKFVWNPEGNPYLIRSGDTLGTISRDKYGTTAYWKNIWQNNTPLIKNPNRIFAGFTIYTPLIEGRGVANSDI